MNENWTRYGRQRLADAITGGESLAIAADQLANEPASPAGIAAFGGSFPPPWKCWTACALAGFKFRGDAMMELPGQGRRAAPEWPPSREPNGTPWESTSAP